MLQDEEIQICMAIHDPKGTYSKYAGVTMLSILENTSGAVCFHILHDGTISAENIARLKRLFDGHAARMELHEIDMSQLAARAETYRRMSIGTMFRLHLFDALPDDVDRVVQLDVDLVVHLDLRPLWEIDLQGNWLAACRDVCPSRKVIFEKGLVSPEEYVNAGVILWNVAAIRKAKLDFYRESNAFFRRVPDVRLPDEEAVNVIFRGKILQIEDRYNYMAVWTRARHELLDEKVYHFAADVPRANGHFMVDRLFESYLRRTPWWTPEFVERMKIAKANRHAKAAWLRTQIPLAATGGRRRIFWGVGGAIHPFIMDRFDLQPDDVFVDSDERKWGTQHLGRDVKAPAFLKDVTGESPLIFVTIYRYHEVRDVLLSKGYQENVDFFDCKALLDEDLLARFFGERVQAWDAGETI